MPRPEWRVFDDLDFDKIKHTRIQYHQAIQNVAAVGRTFLPKTPTDQHTALIWVPGHYRLAGGWIKGNQLFRSSIGFKEFAIYMVDRQVQVISKLNLHGVTFRQSLLWLEQQVGLLGLESAHLEDKAPYEIPKYVFQTEPFEDPGQEYRLFLGSLFHNSMLAMKEVAVDWVFPKEVVVRPQHFELAMSVTLKDTGSKDTNTLITIGMSPGDELFDAPYFFVSTWPHVMTHVSDSLEVGMWIEEDWTGSVLPLRALIGTKNQRAMLIGFYRESFEILGKHLLT